jgi:hypothetical protein
MFFLLDGSGNFLRGQQILVYQEHFRSSLAHSPGNGAANAASTGDKNSFTGQAEIETLPFGHPSSLLLSRNGKEFPREQQARKGP